MTYLCTYNGSQLTGEVITTNGSAETLYYSYDASGTPVSVKYNNTLYFYVTNLQGDVIAIMNASGTIVVEYTYDAWGYIRNTTGSLKDTLGKANALRYRGYVYDTETCLYYLQSRYYNPGTGRFINADALVSTGQGILGNNMFAYCQNNPIIFLDTSGTRIVGIGFQFEIQANGISIGIEIVVYFDPEVCDGSNFIIASYTYSGYEISLTRIGDILNQMDWAKIAASVEVSGQTLSEAHFNTHFLYTLRLLIGQCLDGISASGGIFLIDGNSNFQSPDDYSGMFQTLSVSGTVRNKTVSGYYSFSPTCSAYGIKMGVSTPGFNPRDLITDVICAVSFDCSYSRSYYSDPMIWYRG